MKKKPSQILAILAVILLAGLYASTLIFALLQKPWANDCLKASIFATFAVPITLYAFLLVRRLLKDKNKDMCPKDKQEQK